MSRKGKGAAFYLLLVGFGFVLMRSRDAYVAPRGLVDKLGLRRSSPKVPRRATESPSPVLASGKLLHAMLKVRDVNASIAFYKACGMRVLSYSEYPNGRATAFVGFGKYRDAEHFALELSAAPRKPDEAQSPIDVGNSFQYMSLADLNVSTVLESHGKLSPWSTYYEPFLDDPDGYTVKPQRTCVPGDRFQSFWLCVSDLAASKAFYCGTLGMVADEQKDGDDTRTHCVLRFGNACDGGAPVSLGLVEGTSGLEAGDGFDHLALAAADVRAAAEALTAAGADVFLPPTVMFGINITGARDPDGHSIYFVEEAGFRAR